MRAGVRGVAPRPRVNLSMPLGVPEQRFTVWPRSGRRFAGLHYYRVDLQSPLVRRDLPR